ncbi:MAG: recombination-associated protein RdgC [Azoarcus sp.]|jgi:recombination associated protein RdgC|nr:recombination-associated protein RdgC [Azoarcus sp.]
MWFRNLQFYRLPAGWDIALTEFEAQLAARPLQPCGNQDMESRGWVSPRDDDALLRAVDRQWLIALGVESRLLPSSVVRQEADERAAGLAEKQGFRLGRKQMRDLREQVMQELLPRAFTRRRRTWVWIDPIGGWLGIDASSQARAEEVLEFLRDTLDHFPLALLRTELSPASAMTGWLAGEAPANFTVDQDCELRSVSEEKATVRYAHHPLDGGEIKDHLAGGKLPTRLALTFNDRVSFVLTDKLELKRLDFLDVVRENLVDGDDAEALFDAEFALMSGEFQRLLPALVEALGGEQATESLAATSGNPPF